MNGDLNKHCKMGGIQMTTGLWKTFGSINHQRNANKNKLEWLIRIEKKYDKL